MIGDYTALNYFQSIKSKENSRFIELFRAKFGQDRVLSDYMEAAYFGVHLWAQAVNDAGSTEIKLIRKNIKNQAYNAPEGIVSVDQKNQHSWKIARIGKIQSNGQYNILWTSEKSIPPIPYPTEYRTKEEWDKYLNELYVGWGGKWSAN